MVLFVASASHGEVLGQFCYSDERIRALRFLDEVLQRHVLRIFSPYDSRMIENIENASVSLCSLVFSGGERTLNSI